jgi:hypothetical protein
VVPPSARTWFVIHFVADVLFAVPLFFFPETTLSLLGWTDVDPAATRLVAAALFGIGIPMQEHPLVGLRDLEHAADLLGVQALDVPQGQHDPVVVGKGLDRLGQGRARLGPPEQCLRSLLVPVRGRLRPASLLVEPRERQ